MRCAGARSRRLGVYTATGLGFATSIVATRVLGPSDYARYATVMAAVGFFQLLLDLTIDEALIKYGFRYTTTEDWGRLRRLFRIALVVKVAGGAARARRAARSWRPCLR